MSATADHWRPTQNEPQRKDRGGLTVSALVAVVVCVRWGGVGVGLGKGEGGGRGEGGGGGADVAV